MSNTPANMPKGYGGVSWTVNNVSQGVGQDATGRYVKGWEVTYQLDSGHAGTVFVPGDVLNRDAVKAAIAQHANALADVVNLTSGS